MYVCAHGAYSTSWTFTPGHWINPTKLLLRWCVTFARRTRDCRTDTERTRAKKDDAIREAGFLRQKPNKINRWLSQSPLVTVEAIMRQSCSRSECLKSAFLKILPLPDDDEKREIASRTCMCVRWCSLLCGILNVWKREARKTSKMAAVYLCLLNTRDEWSSSGLLRSL